MRPVDVVVSEDENDSFADQSRVDAFISIATTSTPAIDYYCIVAPGLTAERQAVAREWFASLLTHLEEHDIHGAVEMDGWQLRSDGRWQLWGRSVELPEL